MSVVSVASITFPDLSTVMKSRCDVRRDSLQAAHSSQAVAASDGVGHLSPAVGAVHPLAGGRRWGWAFRALVALALLGLLVAGDGRAQEAGRGRLVVLGFDGADAGLVEQWMASGELPNLAALARQGSHQQLLPTNPAQTPVSWSTFSTGLDPGRTQIMDFLTRQPQSYFPEFAMNTPGEEPFRVLGLRSQAFGLVAGTVLGLLVGIAGVVVRRIRRGPRRQQSLRHGRGALMALAVFVVGMVGGIAGSSFVDSWLPTERPVAINHRQGTPFWEIAADQGIRARVVRVPATFPAVPIPNGEVISGLGVPDIRGLVGKPTLYTTDPSLRQGETEFSVAIVKPDPRQEPMQTVVLGPPNQLFYDAERRSEMEERGIREQLDLPLTLSWLPDERAADIGLPDGESLRLGVGEWSDWVTFEFRYNFLVRMRGIGRFFLDSVAPDLNVYFTPVHFHPAESPKVGFTAPPGLGPRLVDEFGLFKTMGWAIDTWTISDGLLDERYFLDDVEQTVSQYRRMMGSWLARDDWDLHVQVYAFTDRVGHVMWRLIDPEHPMYDEARAAEYAGAIKQAYLTMDEIVGEARAALRPEDRLVVLSDHGFASWRYSFNINTWLVDNGYQVLRAGAEDRELTKEDFTSSDLFAHVDWSRTRAYALGLGAVYLNVMGREPQGIVRLGDEFRELKAELAAAMESWVDPATGLQPVFKVYDRNDMYELFDPAITPDLRVANNPPYRVGWQDTLGGLDTDPVTPNLKNWSADHCSLEPELVKGILFSSFGGFRDDAYIGDLAPTILELVGAPVPADLDGTSLIAPPGGSR